MTVHTCSEMGFFFIISSIRYFFIFWELNGLRSGNLFLPSRSRAKGWQYKYLKIYIAEKRSFHHDRHWVFLMSLLPTVLDLATQRTRLCYAGNRPVEITGAWFQVCAVKYSIIDLSACCLCFGLDWSWSCLQYYAIVPVEDENISELR